MNLSDLQAKIKELKAYCDVPVAECCTEVKKCCDYEYDINYLKSEVQSIYRWIFQLESALYEHSSQGHLPKIPGAGKMQEILEILNLQNDFKVERKEVFASNGKRIGVNISLILK
jgi:hypothetical protein